MEGLEGEENRSLDIIFGGGPCGCMAFFHFLRANIFGKFNAQIFGL